MPREPYVPDYQPIQNSNRPRLVLALGLLVLALACLAVTVFGFNAARGRLAALRTTPSPTPIASQTDTPTPTEIPAAAAELSTPLPSSTPSPSPTLPPTQTATPEPTATATVSPECEQGYLFVAGRVYTIDALAPMPDGSVRIPAGSPPDAAYYLEGSAQPSSVGAGYAIFLPDSGENQLLLDANLVGGLVSILWRGCLLEDTTLLGAQRLGGEQVPTYDPLLPGVTLFLAQSGIEIPLPSPTAGPALSPSTAAPEPAVQPTTTPPPTHVPAPTIPPPQGAVEGEIGFEDKQVSSSTITLTISVYNYGSNAFTLYSTDVALVTSGGSRSYPASTTPALPYSFPSGASQTFSFSFPNPGGSGIVLQILSAELNLDDY